VKRDDFERLYEAHAQPLLGFLFYRTGDRALAEDILADTFERVYSARRSFNRRKASEKTWLYTIALNCLRDQHRRAQAEVRALERAGPGGEVSRNDSVSERVEARDALSRALVALSEEEREAVSLRYGADLTLPEIAKVKGEKLTTVEGRVYRALRKLREELDSAAEPRPGRRRR